MEPELSVEDGEAVQFEETELEPPTLEMERPVQTADELEEQTGEEPIQMVEQTEKPEPEKIASVDMNAIMVMLLGMKEENNKNRQEDKEENNKKRQEDKEEIIKSLKEDMNKNTESLKEENNKNRLEDKEKLDKNIESLREDITEKINDNGKKLEIFQEENKKSIESLKKEISIKYETVNKTINDLSLIHI